MMILGHWPEWQLGQEAVDLARNSWHATCYHLERHRHHISPVLFLWQTSWTSWQVAASSWLPPCRLSPCSSTSQDSTCQVETSPHHYKGPHQHDTKKTMTMPISLRTFSTWLSMESQLYLNHLLLNKVKLQATSFHPCSPCPPFPHSSSSLFRCWTLFCRSTWLACADHL